MAETPANRPERLQWFHDLGFGMFIHWSMDSQLGSVIGHTMAGASQDYLRRFIEELPASFNPKRFDPEDWAVLARLAGVRYVVFTTKHHSGFCMFHTETTDFHIGNTPFGRDITGEIVDAFRRQGIAIGLYFSPDDFRLLHGKGRAVHRGVKPWECEGLLEHNTAQMRELLSNYGKIDILFFDGPSDGLREFCWQTDPDIVITRGAISTPEQRMPGAQSPEPWEACVTMGTAWQFKPTNESYKSGTQLIELLIETRAKGGNLNLNIGPRSNGELAIEQDGLLREIALWHFVNGEAVHGVMPWRVANEGDVWFTASKEEQTVYAFLTRGGEWRQRERRAFSLTSVQASADTTLHVLGQADESREGPGIEWRQEGDRLQIEVARMQRLYNTRRWPNPVVLKITAARLGVVPPAVETDEAVEGGSPTTWRLQGRLTDVGEGDAPEVSFQYRPQRLLTDPLQPWQETERQILASPGEFSVTAEVDPGVSYEFQALAHRGAVTVAGDKKYFQSGQPTNVTEV